MSPLSWVAVAALGGAGALLRFLLDGLVAARVGRDFPFGTLVVNVLGAFLLGLVAALAFGDDALVLAGAATLGSFTTFSTWMLETQRLAEEGEVDNAARNVLVSLGIGLGAVAFGRLVGGRL